MDDLISRQAAIDALRLIPCDLGKRELEDAIKAVEQLPSAQPEPRWIPVEEHLPKASVRYQVTFESGEVGYADFRNKIFLWDGSVKENVWEIEQYYEDDGEVIAWMPSPEPYERSEDEQAGAVQILHKSG